MKLYKAKSAVALALAMSMFCPQVFAADALSAEQQGVQAAPVKELTEEELAAQQLPVLTYEDALAKAKANSSTLRDLDELIEIVADERSDLRDDVASIKKDDYDSQTWVSYSKWLGKVQLFAAEMELESSQLQKKLQNLVLEIGVKSSFVDIMGQEDTLVVARKNAAMQQKLYEQAQVRHRLGMLSTYGTGGLEEKRIAAEQAKNNVALAESALNQTYRTFNRLLGEQPDQRYEMVYDVAYEAYETAQPLDMFISNKMSNDDLSLKLMELSVDAAQFSTNYLPDITTDMLYEGVKDPYDDDERNNYNLDSAKRSLKTAKQEKEDLMNNTYLQIKQLETLRASAEADLKKAEAQYRVAEINYKAGNVTKTVLEQAEMGVINAQNALKTNAYNHDMLVFTFENPSLLQ